MLSGSLAVKSAQACQDVLLDDKRTSAILPGMSPLPVWTEPDISRATPADDFIHGPALSSQKTAASSVSKGRAMKSPDPLQTRRGDRVKTSNTDGSGPRVNTFRFLNNLAHESLGHGVRTDITPRLLRDKWEKPRHRRRRAPFHPRDFFLGTTLGQYCLLGMVVIILIFGGALTWMAVGGTPELPPDFGPSLWISWGLFFDPGTQTGMDPLTHSPRILVTAVLFSIFGYWMMLTNMAMIVEVTRGQLERWEKEHSRVRMVDHILILGWTEKTIFFIKELLHEARDRGIRKQTVVVLAEEDELEMRQSIDDFLPRSRSCYRKSVPYSFVCRKGCPHDPKELEKVSVTSAQDIIVLGQAGNPRESDLQVARVILALASLPQELTGRVLAEVRCADTSPVLEAILLTHIEGIHARSTVNRMLCLMACKPVVGDLLATFSSFISGEEMYCVRVPALDGFTFADACHYFNTALCMGIKPQDGQVLLGPPDDRVIEPTDRLLLIAANEDSIAGMVADTFSKAGTLQTPQSRSCCSSCSCCSRCRRRHQVPLETEEVSPNNGISRGISGLISPHVKHTAERASQVVLTTSEKMARIVGNRSRRPRILTGMDWDFAEDSTYSQKIQPSIFNVLDLDFSGKLFVIIGWPEDLGELLHALDCYVREGCQVHLLSDKPIAEQKEALAKVGLLNIILHFHAGNHISVQCLEAVPLAKAHCILVLAQTGAADDAFASDSSTIACAAMICGICEGKYGRDRKLQLSGRIICEVLDARSERMLQKNPELMKKIKFFKSNALETGLFAMATSEPTIFNILVLLLSPTHDIGKLVSASISKYLSEEEKAMLCEHGQDGPGVGWPGPCLEMSYWQLHDRIRERHTGELLIGWHRSVEGVTKLGADVDRGQLVTWAKKDRLLVLKNNMSVPRIVGRMSSISAHLSHHLSACTETSRSDAEVSEIPQSETSCGLKCQAKEQSPGLRTARSETLEAVKSHTTEVADCATEVVDCT